MTNIITVVAVCVTCWGLGKPFQLGNVQDDDEECDRCEGRGYMPIRLQEGD